MVSKTTTLRAAALLVGLVLLVPVGAAALTNEPQQLEAGTITEPANGTTVIAVQGFKLSGQASGKKPARLVGVGPAGEVRWVHNGGGLDVAWFYDVDPVNGSNVLVTGVAPGKTIVYEWNPRTDETLWVERFHIEDTHDVDLINGDQLLIANMRSYNETTGENDDRVLVYNLTTDRVEWEWLIKERYPQTGGGTYTDDWTHVNDVDKIAAGRYLVSNRNFDQVVVVNRSTKRIELRLGSDGDHDTLYEQHNPQFLRGTDGTATTRRTSGTATMLVADSENDRVVEYARMNGTWTRTWRLGANASLNWPRDADRLPNGNTLVTDTLNHRVIEVTRDGEIVWEFYAPWGTYDAERMNLGDEPGGPTIREQNASGVATVTGSAGLTPGTGGGQTVSQWVASLGAGTPLASEVAYAADRYAHITPWIRPVWMDSWTLASGLLACLVAAGWGVAEIAYHRRELRAWVNGKLAQVPS